MQIIILDSVFRKPDLLALTLYASSSIYKPYSTFGWGTSVTFLPIEFQIGHASLQSSLYCLVPFGVE